jgi:hypothetical protein
MNVVAKDNSFINNNAYPEQYPLSPILSEQAVGFSQRFWDHAFGSAAHKSPIKHQSSFGRKSI